MTMIILQRPVLRPCSYCYREIDDPESSMPSTVRGAPDRDWLTMKVVQLSENVDQEVSFGPVPGALVPLCVACRDGLIRTLNPDTILDYRDGGSVPKIVSGREPE